MSRPFVDSTLKNRRSVTVAVPELERHLATLAVAWPTLGSARSSAQLRRAGIVVAATTNWRLIADE